MTYFSHSEMNKRALGGGGGRWLSLCVVQANPHLRRSSSRSPSYCSFVLFCQPFNFRRLTVQLIAIVVDSLIGDTITKQCDIS